MKIVGEITVKQTHSKNKKDIWNLTKNKNSVLKKEFDLYFQGKEKAFAYEVKEYKKYSNKYSLQELGFLYTPQGFVYADNVQGLAQLNVIQD